MTTKKILEVVNRYRKLFEEMKIPKKRVDPSKPFPLDKNERLAHAHYLLDGIEEYAKNPEQEGKTGRHLGSVQTILMLTNVYILEEVMNHNKPDL